MNKERLLKIAKNVQGADSQKDAKVVFDSLRKAEDDLLDLESDIKFLRKKATQLGFDSEYIAEGDTGDIVEINYKHSKKSFDEIWKNVQKAYRNVERNLKKIR